MAAALIALCVEGTRLSVYHRGITHGCISAARPYGGGRPRLRWRAEVALLLRLYFVRPWCARLMPQIPLRPHRDLEHPLRVGGWLAVAPGDQTPAIKRLAVDAIEFLEERELVRPSAAARGRCFCGLGSPNAHKSAPAPRVRLPPLNSRAHAGGEVISVSYPHESMSHAEQLLRPEYTPPSARTGSSCAGSARALARWAAQLSLNAPTSALIATSTSTSTSTRSSRHPNH
eukprot:SAG11_NODE_10147_length_851_cov_2.378989_1_plen_229_part_10